MYFDDSHITTTQSAFLDSHLRQWKNISIVSNRRELQKQAIIDCNPGWSTIITDTNKHNPRTLMVRKIIGEGTNRLADAIYVGKRLFTLGTVGFDIAN